MNRNVVETVMGAVVIAVAGLFIYFVAHTVDIRAAPGYEIGAVFSKVGGLTVGSDVRISGIKVGTITDRHLDPASFDAVVRMTVDESIKLPSDTVAVIASESPLGGRYLELQPGTAEQMIQPGGLIRETRGYRSLEDQVGEIIFLATARPDNQQR
jgi:phospholipid/cholesterol/gamma-HCH transport system substrate-binding protein